jgi:hypothetical protein
MRGRCAFKKTDAIRAIRAVLAAGLEIARVEFRKDEIVVVSGKPAEESEPKDNGDVKPIDNPWDEVLREQH